LAAIGSLAAARVVVAAAAVAPLGDASAGGEFFGVGELAVAVGVEATQESGGDAAAVGAGATVGAAAALAFAYGVLSSL
jgi:hypothetical protein